MVAQVNGDVGRQNQTGDNSQSALYQSQLGRHSFSARDIRVVWPNPPGLSDLSEFFRFINILSWQMPWSSRINEKLRASSDWHKATLWWRITL